MMMMMNYHLYSNEQLYSSLKLLTESTCSELTCNTEIQILNTHTSILRFSELCLGLPRWVGSRNV